MDSFFARPVPLVRADAWIRVLLGVHALCSKLHGVEEFTWTSSVGNSSRGPVWGRAALALVAGSRRSAKSDVFRQAPASARSDLAAPLPRRPSASVSLRRTTSTGSQIRLGGPTLCATGAPTITCCPTLSRSRPAASVNFIIGGFHHVVVYADGKKPSDVNVKSVIPTDRSQPGTAPDQRRGRPDLSRSRSRVLFHSRIASKSCVS